MQLQYKNINVFYDDFGKGNAVVLLHGFLENRTMWQFHAAELAKKYRVITIDLLGHGETENYGYIHTMQEQAEMVKTILNQLKLRKYVLIGHSMGGYVALTFAYLFPNNLRGLSLMNSTSLPDSEEKKLNRERGILAVKNNHKTFVKNAIPLLFAEKNKEKFNKEIDEITKEALKISSQGIIAALEGMKARKDTSEVLKTSTFSMQLILGKNDPVLDYKQLLQLTKSTKVKVVQFEDGHMSHIENKQSLLEALLEFIKTT